MMNLVLVNFKWIVRDRILQALVAVSLLLILFVPVISSFSFKQSQEIAITLSISFISFILLLYSVFLGSTMLWRDIERRYTFSVVSLPYNRNVYIIAKFMTVAVFLVASSIFLCCCAAIAIKLGSMQYQSMLPVKWGRIFLAIYMGTAKYILLSAVAFLISSFATSFFMPFFSTVAVYLAGSASQEVYDYIISGTGRKFSEPARFLIKCVYYIIPNFNSFDFTLQAVYPIRIDAREVIYLLLYFVIYTAIVLTLAAWSFSRREIT
jgi:ABC-type transport system involved in multi-copper enzyme maturation permease subunit